VCQVLAEGRRARLVAGRSPRQTMDGHHQDGVPGSPLSMTSLVEGGGSPVTREMERVLVASLAERHRLLARRLRRHALEKGLLLLALRGERAVMASARRAFLTWRAAAGRRSVAIERLEGCRRAVIGLQRQKRALRADVYGLRDSFLAEFTRLRHRVVTTAAVPLCRQPPAKPLAPPLPPPDEDQPAPASLPSPPMASPSPAAVDDHAPLADQALRRALLDGDAEGVARVLGAGPGPGQGQGRGEEAGRAFHVALEGLQFHGSHARLVQTLRVLRRAGGSPNRADVQGNTPLHRAVVVSTPRALFPVVQALVAMGADPGRCNGQGETPLHAAVRCRRAGEVVEVLHLLTPTPSGLSSEWAGPSLAAALGHVDKKGGEAAALEMMERLLEAGASWEAPAWRDRKGRSQGELLAALM
jgi:hypothetical protein